MFVPEFGSNRQSINTFVQAKTSFPRTSRLKSARQVNPHFLVQFGLNKGAAEVNRASVPVENEGKNQEESYGAPSYYGSEGVEGSLFQVSSAHAASLVSLNVAIRSSFATKDPL